MTFVLAVVALALLGVVFWTTNGWLGELVAGFMEDEPHPYAWILFAGCAAAVIGYLWTINQLFA